MINMCLTPKNAWSRWKAAILSYNNSHLRSAVLILFDPTSVPFQPSKNTIFYQSTTDLRHGQLPKRVDYWQKVANQDRLNKCHELNVKQSLHSYYKQFIDVISSSSVFEERTASHLVSGQNFEGGHDLVGRVCVSRFPGHEVNEGLEGDDAHAVGVHDAHDAGKLILPLVVGKGRCKAETLARGCLGKHLKSSLCNYCTIKNIY